MRITATTLVITLIATQILVSSAFLLHHQKSLLQLQCSGQIHQTNFASLPISTKLKHTIFRHSQNNVLVRHRRSVANTQTMGLFGLGGAEIAIIVTAGVFIVGPRQVGSMMGSMTSKVKGDLPDELRKIPNEFQKGVEESTENARARNAKPMELPTDEQVLEK